MECTAKRGALCDGEPEDGETMSSHLLQTLVSWGLLMHLQGLEESQELVIGTVCS